MCFVRFYDLFVKYLVKYKKNNLKYYKIYFKKVSKNICLNIKNISTY